MLDIVASIGRVCTYNAWVHHCQILCAMAFAIPCTTMCHGKSKQYLNEREKTIRQKFLDNLRITMQSFTKYMSLKYQILYLSSHVLSNSISSLHLWNKCSRWNSVIIINFHGSGLHLIITRDTWLNKQMTHRVYRSSRSCQRKQMSKKHWTLHCILRGYHSGLNSEFWLIQSRLTLPTFSGIQCHFVLRYQ